MILNYTLEAADMAAYIADYLLNTKDGRRQVLHRSLAPSVTCCALLAIVGLFRQDMGLTVVAVILFPVAFLGVRFAVPRWWRRNAAKYSTRHPEMLGPRELEVSSDTLIHRAAGSESRTPLSKVLSVTNAATVIVIHLGAGQDIVVPKRNLAKDAADALLKMENNPNKAVERD